MKHWACFCSNKITTNDAQETPPTCTRLTQPGEPHGPMTLIRVEAPKAMAVAEVPDALADAFFGIDRKADVSALQGVRVTSEFIRNKVEQLVVADVAKQMERRDAALAGARAFQNQKAAIETQMAPAAAPPSGHVDLSCNHEAELSKLRAERASLVTDNTELRDRLGDKDHLIAELQREVGRQSLELRRSRR